MPPQSEDGYFSSLGLKIHKSRGDHFHVSADTWLEEKGNNDGAEGLWRIHDDLYDFSNFIDRHPGGSMWLKSTKGTDITEAFECHHITLGPEKLLQKFHIRKAVTPRNSPFTFHEDGFYRQLKKQVREVLKDIPKNVTRKSKFIADGLFLSYVITAIFATRYMNYYIGTLSGILLALVTIAAHNFFHQKDSFRMYYFDLSLMSSREWRISHALSHHLYTNTIIDMEIQMFEPIMQFLPMKKSFIVRYVSWIYCPLFYMAVFTLVFLRRTIVLFKGEFDKSEKTIIIPFIIPILMCIFGGRPIIDTILIWAYIIIIGSTYFGIVGINAGHHRPDVFHDGDTPRAESVDWGISQLDAAMDRLEITGSHFLVLTNFGDHALHHLFPTMDHGMLNYLYPTFKQVCAKFDVELRMASQLDMVKGTFKQLANTTPNPLHPGQKQN